MATNIYWRVFTWIFLHPIRTYNYWSLTVHFATWPHTMLNWSKTILLISSPRGELEILKHHPTLSPLCDGSTTTNHWCFRKPLAYITIGKLFAPNPLFTPGLHIIKGGKGTKWAPLHRSCQPSLTLLQECLETSLQANWPVNHLPTSFLSNHIKQGILQVVAYAWVAHDLISEDHQPKVVHIVNVVLLDIHSVLRRRSALQQLKSLYTTWQYTWYTVTGNS